MKTGRRKRFRNRGKRKERIRKEKVLLWKLLANTQESQPSVDWETCNVTWRDWDLDLAEFKKLYEGKWKQDEGN